MLIFFLGADNNGVKFRRLVATLCNVKGRVIISDGNVVLCEIDKKDGDDRGAVGKELTEMKERKEVNDASEENDGNLVQQTKIGSGQAYNI